MKVQMQKRMNKEILKIAQTILDIEELETTADGFDFVCLIKEALEEAYKKGQASVKMEVKNGKNPKKQK